MSFEHEFFEMYERQGALSFDLGCCSVTDWVLIVRDKKGVAIGARGEEIVHVQHCDRAKVFAEAYYKLAEYLEDKRDGY